VTRWPRALALAALLSADGARAEQASRLEAEARAAAPPEAASLYAPHHGEGGYFTPWGGDDARGLGAFLRWQFSRNPYGGMPREPAPRVANDGASLARPLPLAAAEITWVGHATFAVHDGRGVFLTDPHFGERALLPARLVPPGVPLAAIPRGAFAVVSHNHYDHLDAFTVDALPADFAWFVPRGLADWFRARGRENVVELDWWQSARRGPFTITCLPSQHWSKRIEQSTNESLWCAWLIDSGEHRYFFAGDTGYFHGFAEVGRRFGPIDAALLPIGGYEPRWFMDFQHMDPAQALRAFRDLRARTLFPMHWGTFELTDEPPDEAPRELKRRLPSSGVREEEIALLAVGETRALPPVSPAP
jgi:N-acyl-phosphatidylethanolamine-hydrolysing phospholipase D